MSDVFLSYKAEDRARIEPLVRALEAEGLSVWWDAQITAGSEWRDDIQEQLDNARCVVVAWSRRAIAPEGRFVRDEAARAQRRGTYLPIRIDKIEPPLGFGEIQALPMIGWRGNRRDRAYQALVKAIRLVMEGRPSEIVHPATARVSRRELIGGGIAAAAAVGAGAWFLLKPSSARARSSIAVLPFANLSGDPSQTYFSDGIAEELRTALSRLDGLRVVGRISSEAVRDEDARTAARRLQVATILTGSVRRAPGMVRVTSQLIDGKSGVERWSASYDRPEGNVLAIQSDIAENVVSALSLEIGQGGVKQLSAGGTADADALDLYLRATAQVRQDDSESSLQQSNALLDAAIAKDPRYANAYAAKSRNLSYLADVGRTPEETAAGYRAAAQAARKALSIAPRLAIGHAALADALYGQRRISAAMGQVDEGLRFSPNDLELLQAAVVVKVAAGQTRQALAYADRMVDLDPLNALPHRRRYYALFYGRQYDDCIAEAQRTLNLAPSLTLPPYFIALSLIMTGRPKEAEEWLKKLPADLTVRLAGEAIAAAKLGDRTTSNRKLEHLQSVYGDAASYQFAQVYAQRGESDRAFAALKRGFEVNDPGLNTLKVDPLLDPLRKDRRFAAMAQAVDVRS